jgi:hypothetical protein
MGRAPSALNVGKLQPLSLYTLSMRVAPLEWLFGALSEVWALAGDVRRRGIRSSAAAGEDRGRCWR